jgi:hypothetical protein
MLVGYLVGMGNYVDLVNPSRRGRVLGRLRRLVLVHFRSWGVAVHLGLRPFL